MSRCLLFVLFLSAMAIVMVSAGQLTNKSQFIIATDHMPISISRLVTSCFGNLPASIQDRCRAESSEVYAKTLYRDKRLCCSRWLQLDCLKPYLFNAIYCNQHESRAVNHFFEQILRHSLSENGDCAKYPPPSGKRAKYMKMSPQCIPKGEL